MKILSTIIAHPLRKIAGATNAGRDLSVATADLADIELAIMWDRDETLTIGKLPIQHLRCTNPLDVVARWAPRSVLVPLYDSKIPERIRDYDYDLVHIHNLVPAFAAERVARACRSRGIPYVISTHGFNELSRYASINGFGWLKSALVNVAITRPFRRIVAGAAGIFALSDREVDLLASLGVSEERIHVVTNGVNEFYLEPPTNEELAATRERFRIGAEPILLFMGSLHRYKGVDIFLKSLRSVQGPFQAIVAGKFKDDGERSSLLNEARLGDELASRVVFTGGVSNKELRALYHLAELFVYPTLADSLPLVILEAMACGLPVVSTTVGGIPFAVRPEAGILVPPGEVDAVSRAVNELRADPSRRRAMGTAARARVIETFRWSAAARRAVDGYHTVLEASRAPHRTARKTKWRNEESASTPAS